MINNALSHGSILHGNQYNYKIEKALGQGAFGITYLAKVSLRGQLGQLDSNVYVTIKEFFMKEINGREGTNITSSSSSKRGLFYEYKQKFAREAKNLSKLKHSNIVNVMDFFEANNTYYYVMEYLSGGDLDTLIEKRGGLSEEETVRITKQIVSALSFMHQNKMLHLDLKPKNVMLNADGNAILIDFGLSKQYDSSGEPESSTTVGRGTPGYAPLEQANYQEGHGFPITMDVYALGATMYKMITGVRAPEASEILNDGFPKHILSSKCQSREIAACVEKAMAPIKKERYQTVDELLKVLSTCSKNENSKKPIDDNRTSGVPILDDDGGDWGFYETVDGESEYGTLNIVKHRVTTHIPIPDTIKIIRESSNTGNNYSIVLHKDKNAKGYVSIVDVMGERIQKEISGGIPNDVMRYLKDKGFFSNIHWEIETSTTRLKTNEPVNLIFEYKGGGRYSRFVSAPDHMLLRRAVDGLLFNTSLDKYISTLTMKETFEPDDILGREETIYGGPPVDEQQESPEEKDQKEDGCIVYILLLLAIAMHCLYPAMWCLTFLSDNFFYPNLWSVGIAWFSGIILGFIVIGEGKDKEWLQNLGLWALLLIETAIVYFVNYILVI